MLSLETPTCILPRRISLLKIHADSMTAVMREMFLFSGAYEVHFASILESLWVCQENIGDSRL